MHLRLLQSNIAGFGLLVLVVSLIQSPSVSAQPFINPGVTAFSPEISVVNTGVLQDAQATVSADRRYVTITARPQNSQLLSLSTYQFQSANGGAAGGVVGGAVPGAVVPVGNGVVINAPVAIGAGSGVVLSQRGITKLVGSKVTPRVP